MTETIVDIPAAEVVEETLDNLGLPWNRRESGWVIVAGRHRPCEVTLSSNDQGLRIEAELCSWDNVDETAIKALALVLGRADAGLPHAKCKIDGSRAVVVAWVSRSQIETRLPTALSAVLVGSRALAREAVAVLSGDLANHVLQFFASGEERFFATERI